jgi:O-antigen ligase
MTLSRGSFVAVFAGLVVLFLMRPRAATVATAVAALVPVGVLAVALFFSDKVKATPSAPPVQFGQGELLAALVVVLAAVTGLAYALIVPRLDGLRGRWRPSFRLASALAVVATLVILAGTVAISYASEQSEDVATSASRVTEAKTFRGPYWDVALGAFANHPLNGVGSGSFLVEWRRENVVPRGAFDAHSLYFETLGELGIVGGLLLAALVAAIALGTVAAARELPRDPVLPAAAAVLAAAAVHVGVDWDWEQPGVMLPVLLLAAAALTRPEADIDSFS